VTILVVEDDTLQYEPLQRNLQREFEQVQFKRIKTGKAFLKGLDALGKSHIQIALIDVMIPWQTTAEDQQEIPQEVKESDYRNIGVLCARWLAGNPSTARIPVILYTELDKNSPGLETALPTLPPHVKYLGKAMKYPALNRMIREMIRQH
jgi:CheY-like chemotaxis protein